MSGCGSISQLCLLMYLVYVSHCSGTPLPRIIWAQCVSVIVDESKHIQISERPSLLSLIVRTESGTKAPLLFLFFYAPSLHDSVKKKNYLPLAPLIELSYLAN